MLTLPELPSLNWEKVGGLMPAIIQCANTGDVLMLGYMNQEALAQTISTQRVTFYSRTKKRLWVKGETSGNTLALKSISCDCDQDSLLVSVEPAGPVCHKGTDSCFARNECQSWQVLSVLEGIIQSRVASSSNESYTKTLYDAGIEKVAQKVGEEAVETVVAALAQTDQEFIAESADLLYHWLVLLRMRNKTIKDVFNQLSARML